MLRTRPRRVCVITPESTLRSPAGGATPPEAMVDLKRLGFTAVINFRTSQEEGVNIEASQTAAADAGLKYFHIPFRAPSPEGRRGVPRYCGRPLEPAGVYPLRVRESSRRHVVHQACQAGWMERCAGDAGSRNDRSPERSAQGICARLRRAVVRHSRRATNVRRIQHPFAVVVRSTNIPNQGRSRVPRTLPIKADTSQSHPCSDPDATPLK